MNSSDNSRIRASGPTGQTYSPVIRVGCPDRSGQPRARLVGDRHRLGLVGVRDDGDDGAEHLTQGGHPGGRGRAPREHRWFVVVAADRRRGAPPAGDDPRARGRARRHVGLDARPAVRADQRAHGGFLHHGITDQHGRGLLPQPGHRLGVPQR